MVCFIILVKADDDLDNISVIGREKTNNNNANKIWICMAFALRIYTI